MAHVDLMVLIVGSQVRVGLRNNYDERSAIFVYC